MAHRPKKKVVKRSTPRYRLARFKEAFRKRLKILLFSLVLVAGVLVLAAGVYLFQALKEGLTLAASVTVGPSREVNTASNFNLLFFKIDKFEEETSLIREMKVLNFQVAKKTLNVLDIPVDQAITNFSGNEPVKIASLYGLSNLSNQQDGRGDGENESRFSFEKNLVLNLGLPLDGYIYTDEAGLLKVQEKLNLKEGPFKGFLGIFSIIKSLPLLGSVVKTNLTLRSTLALAAYVILSFPNKVESYTATDLAGDTARFDNLVRNKLADPQIEAESLKIIVLNGTKKTGLASSVGRVVANLGLTLISVANVPEGQVYQNSLLIAKSKNYFSVSRLAGFFGLSDIRASQDLESDSSFDRLLRADLVLIAGNDQLFDK